MSTNRALAALLALARAQLAARAARVRFLDTDRSTAERTVDVLALSFDPPRWLVAAWSPERGSLRLLDVARVLRVRPARRRAGDGPAAFDPVDFARRSWFAQGAGPPRPVTIRLASPWDSVASALLPAAEVRAGRRGRGAALRVVASRPDVLRALANSLSPTVALDSESSPCRKRRRSPTRRASSDSPRGSSRRARR